MANIIIKLPIGTGKAQIYSESNQSVVYSCTFNAPNSPGLSLLPSTEPDSAKRYTVNSSGFTSGLNDLFVGSIQYIDIDPVQKKIVIGNGIMSNQKTAYYTTWNTDGFLVAQTEPSTAEKLPTPVLTLTNEGAGKINVQGVSNSHAEYTAVRYSDSESGLADATVHNLGKISVTNSIWGVLGLPQNTTYYFQARFLGDGENYETSDWSAIASITTLNIETLPAPVLTEVGKGEDSVKLGGLGNENASSIEIRYSTSLYSIGTAVPQSVTQCDELTVGGLDNDTTYYFQARFLGDGENYETSDWSDMIIVKTEKAFALIDAVRSLELALGNLSRPVSVSLNISGVIKDLEVEG